MKLNVQFTSWFAAALLAATGIASAAPGPDAPAAATTETVKFSDPSKPGTLKLTIANGDIRITGSDSPEISVTSEAKAESSAPRPDGLRVLTASSSYSLVEKNNVVTLSYGSGGWPTNGGDFVIRVPHNTNVVISNSLGGDVDVEGVTGDLEIKSLNGEVKLADVSGGALVETMNGEIHATVKKLTDGKPISFTSMNGEVQLYVPADGKANVRLRTHNGTILTDFDDKQLVTKTTSLGGAYFHGSGNEIQAAVRDAVRVGVEAAREATRAAREAIREAHQNQSEDAEAQEAPEPPVPPMAPLPPMTGGKMVTGTLNGGGPEIRVTTMNGSVTLRKAEAKKS
jgi:hypothetical protein